LTYRRPDGPQDLEATGPIVPSLA